MYCTLYKSLNNLFCNLHSVRYKLLNLQDLFYDL